MDAERQFSGMTVGEIMRLVLEEAAERGDDTAAAVLSWDPPDG